MNNSQITSGTGGVADMLVQEALSWITGSGLKHWRMIPPPATGTMTIGSDAVPFPSDFYEPIDFWITGRNQQRLAQKTMQETVLCYNYDGTGARVQQQPLIWYFDQAAIRMDSPADQAYPYLLNYYQNIPDLSASNPTNFITTYYGRLLRCAIMAHAAEWAKDSGVGNYDRGYWVQQALMEQAACQADSDRAKRGTEFSAVMVGGGAPGFAPWGGYW